MTRLTWLPTPFVRIARGDRIDLDDFAIAGIVNEKVRVYKVNADLTNGGELTYTATGGKTDSVQVTIDRNGDVIVTASEAQAPGASGSTSQPNVERIPGVFPPYIGTPGPQGPPGEVTRNYLFWDGWTAAMLAQWLVTMRAVNIDVLIDERLRELGLIP